MQGGVVFRAGDHLLYLPATVAMKVMSMPDVARVPGGPPELVGVALVDGDTLPVVSLGERPRPSMRVAMLVAAYLGERVGLVGLEVLATGRFEPTPTGSGVDYGGREARLFDVAGLVAKISAGRWAV
jgi:chemotaxis signal transduction protein